MKDIARDVTRNRVDTIRAMLAIHTLASLLVSKGHITEDEWRELYYDIVEQEETLDNIPTQSMPLGREIQLYRLALESAQDQL